MNDQTKKTILLVEDEALIALAEARAIESFGYAVVTASSGVQAVRAALSNGDVSLILMDIDLGHGLSGPEAATKILSEKSLPIVFLTSHPEREMVEKVRGITRYGYVIKDSGDFVLQSSIEMAFELFEAHQQTRQREATLRTVQEMAHIGDWIWDAAKKELTWSEEMYRMFGLQRDACQERLVDALRRAIHPDDRSMVERSLTRASGDADPKPTEFRVVWPDGSVHTIWAKGLNREFDSSGHPVVIAGFAQDITERKQAEAQIQLGRQELELALRSSGAGVWHWDMVQQTLHWSDELFDLFGLDPARDTATFDNWAKALHPDDRSAAHERIERAIKTATRLTNDYRIVRPDGQIRWIRALGDTTYDHPGHPIHMTGICIDTTERRNTEAKYRTILQTTIDGFWINDAQGNILEVNEAYCAMSGYDQHELLLMHINQLEVQEDPEATHAHLQKVMRSGNDRFETRHRRKDGAIITVEVSSTCPEPENGRYVVFLRDITEQKRVQRELKESEAQFRILTTLAPAGIYLTDPQGNCLYTNPCWNAMAGMEGGEALGTGWISGLHPEDREKVFRNWQKMVDSQGQWGMEYRFQTREGKISWVYGLAIPVRDAAGEILKYVGLNIDITERRHMEEQLQTSRLLTEGIINAIPARVFWKDRNLVYLGCNTEFARDAGFTDPRDIVGKDDFALAWQDQAELYRADDRAVIDTRCPRMLIEEPQTTPDGRTITLLTSKIPLKDHRDEIIGVLGVYLDISARKQAEEAMAKRLVALTQPLESGAVAFEDLFNPDEIQRIQDEFSQATGVASIITRPDGRPLTAPSNFTHLCSEIIRKTEKGCANCFRSDAALGRYHPDGPVVQQCLSGGLWDGGASIVVGNTHIANWLIGQVRDETQSEENMRAYAREISANEAAFMSAFYEVPAMSRDKFERVARVLFTLASQLSRSAYQNVQQARFITEHNLAEEQIKSLLSEKELLLKEVHHRIKNNMNTMMSLLSLQASSLQDPGSAAALAGARRRMQSMMLLYDKLYRSDNFRKLSIREYLHGLVRDIIDNFPNRDAVTIRMHVDDFSVDARQLSALGIIINELLANAMKYAFAGRMDGVINVTAAKEGARATFVVHDDGVGVPEDLNIATSSGFGLRLVDMLTRQLDGTLRIERSGGTRITLECDV
jgi:PAS domain S-box-containing protein